jgi:hypothetical protein
MDEKGMELERKFCGGKTIDECTDEQERKIFNGQTINEIINKKLHKRHH